MTAVTRTWGDVLRWLVELFADERPFNAVERVVRDEWHARPAQVEAEAQRIAALKEEGAVRSAWAVLRTQLESNSTQPAAVADPAAEQAAAVRRAETWLAAAGHYVPTEAEIMDELFGDRGRLRLWDTRELRAQMVETWRELTLTSLAATRAGAKLWSFGVGRARA